MLTTISKLGSLVMLAGVLLLLVRGDLFSSSPLVIIAQVGALALAIWARRTFAIGQFSTHPQPAAGPMINAGPYKYIRHPMYAAALLLLWSGILSHLSLVNFLIGLVVTFTTAVRIVNEERLLTEHFPDYAQYAGKTKRLVPGVF